MLTGFPGTRIHCRKNLDRRVVGRSERPPSGQRNEFIHMVTCPTAGAVDRQSAPNAALGPGAMNGWLDPEGRFFSIAGAGQHCEWCVQEMKRSCYQDSFQPTGCRLDTTNWVKLAEGRWIVLHPDRLTQSQLDYMFDWHQQTGQEPDAFFQMVRELSREIGAEMGVE